MSGTPCLADTGAGASIELKTTVTGGDSGSSGGVHWSGGGGSGTSNWWLLYLDSLNNPTTTESTMPEESEEPEESSPPVEPSLPEEATPLPGDLPTTPQNTIDWTTVIFVAVMLGLIGLLSWLIFRKRKVPEQIT